MTLYAGWVELRLQAQDNYSANQGKGAVNLSWSQQDNRGKIYKLYQQREEKPGSRSVPQRISALALVYPAALRIPEGRAVTGCLIPVSTDLL